MPDPSNDAFVNALVQRDVVAWGALYDAHLKEIYAFVNHVMEGDRSSVEDVNQEIWMQAMDCIQNFDQRRGELRNWLYGIARRQVALHFRRRFVHSTFPLDDELDESLAATDSLLPDETMDRIDQASLLRAALVSLPDSHRQVLTRKYVQGLTIQEIAVAMETTVNAVNLLLWRARSGLRTLLKGHFLPATKQRRAV
jgi:RNA polymerase sigma-70 factor, ECF subfamily